MCDDVIHAKPRMRELHTLRVFRTGLDWILQTSRIDTQEDQTCVLYCDMTEAEWQKTPLKKKIQRFRV